jgi:hypothetical protein
MSHGPRFVGGSSAENVVDAISHSVMADACHTILARQLDIDHLAIFVHSNR